MAKVIDVSEPAAEPRSLDWTIYDAAPRTESRRDSFYDGEEEPGRSAVLAEVVVCEATALQSLRQAPDGAEGAGGGTGTWPVLLAAVSRLSQLARSKGSAAELARLALAATLAELTRAAVAGNSSGDKYRKEFTSSLIYSNVIKIIEAFYEAYKPMPTTDPVPPITVAALLDDLRPLDEVREHIRQQIAPSAQDLVGPLNKWIKGQTAATLSEKEKVCGFINDLLSISGLYATFGQTPCYFRISKRSSTPEGAIYLMPFASDRQLVSRNLFADLPDIGLAPESSLASDLGQSDWSSRTATSLCAKRNR